MSTSCTTSTDRYRGMVVVVRGLAMVVAEVEARAVMVEAVARLGKYRR